MIRYRAMAIGALLSAVYASGVAAQSVPLDTASLGTGAYSAMRMLFEKTIFKVDVLTLEVRFGRETTAQLERLASGRGPSRALADSIAATALAAGDVWARIEFLRNVRLNQFLDGVRDNLRAAREAGIVTPAEFDDISQSLPQWYVFLNERDIRDGDEMLYRIRGDTLRTTYRTADGTVLLDQTDVGPSRRLSVLGGYFAPGSEFRMGLVASLFPR